MVVGKEAVMVEEEAVATEVEEKGKAVLEEGLGEDLEEEAMG